MYILRFRGIGVRWGVRVLPAVASPAREPRPGVNLNLTSVDQARTHCSKGN